MNSILGRARLVAVAVSGLALVACDSIKNVEEDDFSQLPTPNVVLRGTVNGITASPVVLTAHYVAGSDYVGSAPEGNIVREVAADGPVSFAAIPRNSQYTVTVTGLPIGKLCEVSNGTGTAQSNVTNVAVACVPDPDAPTFTVSGTVVGLAANAAGMQLVLTSPAGEETVGVPAGGDSFAFTSELLTDFDYEVAVQVKPSVPGVGGAPATTHECAVNNGSGSVVDGDITDIEVVCGFLIGGTATGYGSHTFGGLPAGLQLGLSFQGMPLDTIDVPAATGFGAPPASFTFAARQPAHAGGTYTLSILAQPAGQACVLGSGGSVTLTTAANVNSAAVFCNDAPPASGNQVTGTYRVGADRSFVTFFPDGTFVSGTHGGSAGTTGVEHGVYAYAPFYDPTALTLFFGTDTNGAAGLSSSGAAGGVLALAGVVKDAGGISGSVAPPFGSPPGTPGTPWSGATTVASTAGQLEGAWAADSRAFVYASDGTAMHYGVNGVVNLQDVCLVVSAPTGTSGTYTQNRDPATCAIPGGLAPVEVDPSFGFFGLPGAPSAFAPPGTPPPAITYAVAGDALDLTAPGQFGGPPTVTSFNRSVPN